MVDITYQEPPLKITELPSVYRFFNGCQESIGKNYQSAFLLPLYAWNKVGPANGSWKEKHCGRTNESYWLCCEKCAARLGIVW